MTISLTPLQARRFLLSHQGLYPPYALSGKPAILRLIRRLGCIQYDPLNVAGHNHDLVLQARIADYQPDLLRELLYKDRLLLDAWDKNMAIVSTEDWPFFRRIRERARCKYGHSDRPAVALTEEVRQEILRRGPLCSNDLDYNHTVDWPWAPTRISRAVLESMYYWGDLIVHHKVHTRKYYDLASRHLCNQLLTAPDPNPTEEEYHDWYLLRRIGGIGLVWDKAGDAWLGIHGFRSAERRAALTRLLDRKAVVEIGVEGLNEPLYACSSDLNEALTAADKEPSPGPAAVIAPLDNLLWDRRLIEELFGFAYRWEVYKPAAQRQYGYYVLPVLYQDRFVARFEPHYDKKHKTLTLRNWWWEESAEQSPELFGAITAGLEKFASFLGATQISLAKGLSATLPVKLPRRKKAHKTSPQQ